MKADCYQRKLGINKPHLVKRNGSWRCFLRGVGMGIGPTRGDAYMALARLEK